MNHYASALLLATGLIGLLPGASAAGVDRSYVGVATARDGTVAYTEHHTAQFDAAGHVLTARTDYRDPSGQTVGILASDFTRNLTAPSYRYENLASGEVHGIRFQEGAYELFRQVAGQPETRRSLPADFAPDALVVGCQGLHYYLRENMATLQARKRIPIKLLIPGELDYYNFEMRYAGATDDGKVNIDIVIKNPFLRLFAPALNVVYDSATGDLLTYQGLSNISDARGKLQNVTIEYSYADEPRMAVATVAESGHHLTQGESR